ncbi:MAG: type II toxin-antitoxin system RelE/ParE family toxin [Erythrobacter sp.]|nr:type II toxin-antitoxin system RelE/ParE family toxin [Erythrobacter sp.]
MEIESIRHKGLKRLATKGDRRVMEADRLMDMLSFIVAAASIDDLQTPPNFGFHALTGDRSGTYAMTVTRNWRMTFTLAGGGTIADLDLEDYHGR